MKVAHAKDDSLGRNVLLVGVDEDMLQFWRGRGAHTFFDLKKPVIPAL